VISDQLSVVSGQWLGVLSKMRFGKSTYKIDSYHVHDVKCIQGPA